MTPTAFAALLNTWPIKGRLGVAVSGGSDSMALARLAKTVLGEVVALHFNHGLRPEAAAEAAWVKGQLEGLGIPTCVGTWPGPHPRRNIQALARQARYQFFAAQQAALGLQAVLVAHTQDDVLETFLLRLGRGSSVRGLCGLAPTQMVYGATVWRPLLTVPRAALQDYLTTLNQSWLTDPSNTNPAFWRPRLRALTPALRRAGINAVSVQASISALREADVALDVWVDQLWQQSAISQTTQVGLPFAGLVALPFEVQLRLVQRAYRTLCPTAVMLPRREKFRLALSELANKPKRRSLGEVYLRQHDGVLWLTTNPKKP